MPTSDAVNDDCPDTTVEREENSRASGWKKFSFGVSLAEKGEWMTEPADDSDDGGPIVLIASTVAWNSRARFNTSSRLLVMRLEGDAGRRLLVFRVPIRAGVWPTVAELATDIGLVKGVERFPGTGIAIGTAAGIWEASGANGSITCISTSTADVLVVLESDETLETCGGQETWDASIKTAFELVSVGGSEELLRVVDW